MTRPPCSVDLDLVAVAPDAREALEVGRAILGVVGVVPESRPASTGTATCRRARPSLAAGRDRPAVVIVDVDLHAEAAALQLAAPHRQRRAAEREAGHDVGAAGDRRQAEIVLHALVDVIEALRRERAAGREQRAQVARARSPCAGRRAIFFARSTYLADVPKCVIRSASAKSHRSAAVDERRAVVEQQRRAARARPETSQFHIIQPQVVK